MLKELIVRNLILVESETISLTSGMNVLSGESGSGKTAILTALNLLSGVRADQKQIRHGAEKAVVQAVFDLTDEIETFLDTRGIDCQDSEDLILTREITSGGRSRSFINHQAATLSLLKELPPYLFKIVSQHENKSLLNRETQMDLLDQFGDLLPLRKNVHLGFEKERRLIEELEQGAKGEAERVRTIDRLLAEQEEILEANLQDNEEEELFQEYKQLASAQERLHLTEQLTSALESQKLSHPTTSAHNLLDLDETLGETLKPLKGILLELDEMIYSLTKYRSNIEMHPARLQEIDERLALIKKLERKYQDPSKYLISIQGQLNQLQNHDAKTEEREKELKELTEKNNHLNQQLSSQRKTFAKTLEKRITEELQALNMEGAAFTIKLTPTPKTRKGCEFPSFFLAPNIGEPAREISKSASGGELSRLLLALYIASAGKDRTPTLIFDEIDANIGGVAASHIGEKLSLLGKSHQIVCITHFPQVAKYADNHIRIEKSRENGRTKTVARLLNEKSREEEIARMLG